MQLLSGLMDTADVVVVGAGPTGLMLACELALGGVAVRVLEERASTPNITRAFAVHARTLELLDARGLAEDLIPRGVAVYEIAPPGGTTLDLRELPGRYAMLLIVPQSGTEQVLESRPRTRRADRPRRRSGRVEPGRRRRHGGMRRRRDSSREVRRGMRRCAQHDPGPGRYRLRRQAVRDAHPAGRRRAVARAGGHA